MSQDVPECSMFHIPGFIDSLQSTVYNLQMSYTGEDDAKDLSLMFLI